MGKKHKAQSKQKTGKVEHAKKTIVKKVEKINGVINRLEKEVEGLIKRVVKQGERSRRELKKNFDDLISRIRGVELPTLVTDTRDEVEREIRRLAEDLMGAVREIELASRRIDLPGLFQNIRRNFSGVIDHLSETDLLQRAKVTVRQTRKEVLGLLSIPTQDEVEKLEKKIVSLEKRLSVLSRKAA